MMSKYNELKSTIAKTIKQLHCTQKEEIAFFVEMLDKLEQLELNSKKLKVTVSWGDWSETVDVNNFSLTNGFYGNLILGIDELRINVPPDSPAINMFCTVK